MVSNVSRVYKPDETLALVFEILRVHGQRFGLNLTISADINAITGSRHAFLVLRSFLQGIPIHDRRSIPGSVENALMSNLAPLDRLLCFINCNTLGQVTVFPLSELE